MRYSLLRQQLQECNSHGANATQRNVVYGGCGGDGG